KLQISCHIRVQDGMRVTTNSEKAVQARRAMLEFLLIDHPLDCPVCDQSGECELQNFYMEIGRYDSRFLDNKIKRKKAYPIGPHVILDQERCILCSRCVRFTDEVSRTHELGIFERGDRSVIDLYPGKRLDNKYSGNVIDICPVGALLERDFRFQCRVWYLQSQESICNGCARGCNTQIHYNTARPYKSQGRRILRLRPRFNPFVNRWWLCDEGRYGYEFINKNRIEYPYLRQAGQLELSDWDAALEETTRALKTALEQYGPESIGVIASPQLSNEDLYLIRKIFGELMGVKDIGFKSPWEKPGYQDDFLIRADKNPNSRGAEEMGLTSDVRTILESTGAGRIKVLYVFQHNFNAPEALELLRDTSVIIYQGTNWNQTAERAHVVLPSATYAEKDGTFTNFEGRIQRFRRAVPPLEESKTDFEILSLLAERLEYPLVYSDPGDLYMEWRGQSYEEMDPYGEMLG
ncbi:MAG TPA: molybdopterin-dependent oxidoreductase, partial [Acidobacteriota bacterium]|nr:molybdopterin-dependent oxidoreductase [Acidobacteriota bacterium]